MHHPLISIIVPIYKVEPYLRRCLDSIVNQTYANLEIILVDDGSPDKCPQICDEYATKDNRIVVIHKKNGGLSDARNAGTACANGSYIYYIDSDDELPLNSIQSLYDYVGSNPEAEIIVGKAYCPQKNSLYQKQLFDYDYSVNSNIEFRRYCSSDASTFPVNAWNKLIKKDFIIKNNISFKKGIIHEDELWFFFISKVARNVICTNKSTYIHYINPNSIMTASPDTEKKRSWGIILGEIFSKLDQPLFPEQFFKYYSIFEHASKQLSHENPPLYEDVWKKCIRSTLHNHYRLLATALFFHKLLLNITKGHGTGFVIWFLRTRCYIK